MHAIDILGGMLNRKSSGGGGGGLGGAILDSILKGGRGGKAQAPSRDASATPQRPAGSPTIRESPRAEEFDSLEDLLRHSHERSTTRRRTNQPQAPQQPQPQHRHREPEPHIARRQTEFTAEHEGNPDPFNDKAQVLVIAMVNAAKSDGAIDQKEQDAIVQQLGDLTQDKVQFLRSEFAKPLNVREFVWSVPLGMEHPVYAISLMAVTLDESCEAQYLRDLGHGFRMTLEQCNQIHREFNAPQLR